jgi:hypothetical protein
MTTSGEWVISVAARLLARESHRTEELCEEMLRKELAVTNIRRDKEELFRVPVVVFLSIHADDDRDAVAGAERAIQETLRAHGQVGPDRRVVLTVRDIGGGERPVKVHGVMGARQALYGGHLNMEIPPASEVYRDRREG